MPDFGEIFDREKRKNSKYKRTSQRILVKNENSIDYKGKTGRVIAVAGKNYLVKPDIADSVLIECIPAGTIKSKHGQASLVAVGDSVQYLEIEQGSLGKITSIEERKTWLSRKPIFGIRDDVVAVNSEYLLIIMSAANPRYNKRLLDRLIISAKIGNMIPLICINKIDLAEPGEILEDLYVYDNLNYIIFLTSVTDNHGIDDVKSFLRDKEALLIGPSGVGKSSLINKIAGRNIQNTNEISDKTSKGKHTTSSARIINIDDNLTIIDSPGIREFGIVNITKEELTLYFDDFEPYYEKCRFMPCSHTHEPDCEIIRAVETGRIDFERYESYLNIYSSME